jgi:hypothetical protein
MIPINDREKCYLCKQEFHADDLFDCTVDGIGREPITHFICEDCLKDNPIDKILKGVTSDYIASKEANNE